MKFVKNNLLQKTLILCGASLISAQAMAVGASAGGGMAVATSTAEAFKIGLFLFVGVAAVIYMIYMALMAFTEKKSWSDFGWAIVHVGAAGASVTIATWAWSAFQ